MTGGGIRAVLTLAVLLAVTTPANAATIQLGFILDSSASIGAANWNIIRNGLATGVNTHVPLAGTDAYEVTVVSFSTTAVAFIQNFLVTDAASRTNLANQIAALPFLNAGTTF
jgi:hypothetical protein